MLKYTKEQVDELLSQVTQEFETAIQNIKKNEEEIEVETEEVEEESLAKSEEEESLDYSDEDYKEIDEIYSSMSKSEKEAHYNSIKKAIFGEVVEEESMNKSEVVEEEVKEEELSLIKSENEDLKSQNEKLQKSLDQVNELLEKMFSKNKKAPTQKAITGYNVIAKSEGFEEEKTQVDVSKMAKSEITKKLSTINPEKLSKSEREAINNYYLNNGSVEAIKHLIAE